MAHHKEFESKGQPSAIKIAITVFAALLVIFPLPFGAFITAKGDDEALIISLMIFSTGITMGWFAGILVSPYEDDKEKQIFQSYAKVFTAGASGYLVGKMEPIVTASLQLGDPMEPIKLLRILGFLVTFTVALMCVFGWRRYWTNDAPESVK
jgi:predicted permease